MATKNTNTKLATFQNFKSTNIEKVIVDGYGDKIKAIFGGSDEAVARFNQTVITVISNNSNIKNCTQNSVIGAVLQTSILKLNPAPALGLCAYVPYFNNDRKIWECEFQIQYQGYIQLATRSGKVLDVYAEIRYERDEFKRELGSTPKIIHNPYDSGDRGKMVGVYVVWFLRDAPYPHFEYMSSEEVEKVKKESKSLSGKGAKYSPWNKWPIPMWKKTVTRSSRKYIPFSIEESANFATDERVLNIESFSPTTGSVKPEHLIVEGDGSDTEKEEKKEKKEEVVDRLTFDMWKQDWDQAEEQELNTAIKSKSKSAKKLKDNLASFCTYKKIDAENFESLEKSVKIEFLYFVLNPDIFKGKKK